MPVRSFGDVINEYKAGRLHSGRGRKGAKGPIVTDPAQAKAIAVNLTSPGKSRRARGYAKLREKM
jgi:hypothetical protein